MPLCEFAFVVDPTAYPSGLDEDIRISIAVSQKARETFGPQAHFVSRAKTRSGSLRFFKRRGISVVKTGGKFFLSGDPKKMVVWASVNVPVSFFQKQAEIAGVDLSEFFQKQAKTAGVDLSEFGSIVDEDATHSG